MTEYEKKQLELSEEQKKRLKSIDYSLTIIVGLLGVIMAFLTLIYFKIKD